MSAADVGGEWFSAVMATTTCGYCSLPTHLTLRMYDIGREHFGMGMQVRAVYECDHCHNLSVAAAWRQSMYDNSEETVDRELDLGARWTPAHVAGKKFEDVPEYIASLADEAYRCASIQARRGAVLLARAAIEGTAKDKGASGPNLLVKIDALVSAGDLERRIGNAAHAVRGLGADMAHADVALDVEDEDVEDALEIMSAVLENVYQLDARVSGVLKRRAARKAASKPDA